MTPALSAKTFVSTANARSARTERNQEREQELRLFIFQQVTQAEFEVMRKSPEVDVDAATKFLRKIRRRRVIV